MMLTPPPTIEVMDDAAEADQPDELVPNYDDLEQWPPRTSHRSGAGEETR